MRDSPIDNRGVRPPKCSHMVEVPPEPVPLNGRAQDLGLHRRVDPHSEPQLEHQQRPKPYVMIARETAVFIEQTLDIVRSEKAALLRALREKRVVGELLDLVAEPMVDRTAEAHLGSI